MDADPPGRVGPAAPAAGRRRRPRGRTVARAGVVVLVGSCHALAAMPALVCAALAGRGRVSAVARTRLRRLLVDLGASYVKGAQLLSTRRDVLPPGWCDALADLHDRVPPMRIARTRRILHRAYPHGPISPSDVAWDSVASGSIACVYRATLPDGRQVAVKVRRPGVEAQIRADFTILRTVARALQWLPPLRRVPAVAMIDQLRDAVARQADFDVERRSLRALRDNLIDLDYLCVPEPLAALCRPGVLVMEYIPDLHRPRPREGAVVAERILHCAYRMLFLDGLVHCDMHPGNLYLRPGGRIVLLDAGFVVTLEPRVRALFAEFFLAMARGDAAGCAEAVRRSAARVAGDADLIAFRAGIRELIGSSSRRRAGEFSLVAFATRLFDLQRRCGLFAAPEFVFPLLALLVLEGRVNELSAEVDFQQAALPVLLDALRLGYVNS